MNRIRAYLAAAAVALVGAATVAAPEAQAQAVFNRPEIEYSTQGGFVLWNYKIQIYSTGFVVGTMTSPRNPGETLYLYDYVTTTKVRSLKNALDRANFARLPGTVRTRYMIADLPVRVVTYKGKTVRYTGMGPQSAPVASATYVAAMTSLGNVFTKMADEPLVVYDAAGGIAALHDHLAITRSGRATFDRSFGGSAQPQEERQLDFAVVNALKRKIVAANWWSLPSRFRPPQPVMDGVSFGVTVYSATDYYKTVRSETMATEPAAFRDVMSEIYDIIHGFTT